MVIEAEKWPSQLMAPPHMPIEDMEQSDQLVTWSSSNLVPSYLSPSSATEDRTQTAKDTFLTTLKSVISNLDMSNKYEKLAVFSFHDH